MPRHRCFVCFFLYCNCIQEENILDSLHIPCSRSYKKCFATITVEVVEEHEATQKKIREKKDRWISKLSGSYLVSHQRLPRIIGQWRWLVISQTSIYSNHKSKCLVQHKVSQELQKLNYTSVTQVKFTCQSCFSWLSCLSFAKGLPKWRAHFK